MNAWQITKKDVRLLIRDRRTLFVLVALPMAFISILGFSTGQLFSEREKARKVRLAVVNEDIVDPQTKDVSELSGKLLTEVKRLDALELHEYPDLQHAQEALAEGNVDVMVVIGPEYHTRVEELDLADIFYNDEGRLSNKLGSLDIRVDSGAFLANAAQIVEELVFAFAIRTIAPDVLITKEKTLALRLRAKVEQARKERRESPGAESHPHSPPPQPESRASVVYKFLVPSYTVMFVFFIVNFMARSLIHERDTGTLNRLRMAPITNTGVMLGKTVPFLLISLVQTLLLFIAGRVMFGMSWGIYPWMLAPVMFSTSLAATSLGLMVATAVRTESQVSAYGNFLVLTMAGISGCLMPRSWQPELMQQIGLVTPHAWALIAYDHLLNRDVPNLQVVWHCCGVLFGFALGFFAVGWWRFRTLN